MAIDPNKFSPNGEVLPYYGNTIIAPYYAPDAGAEGQAVLGLAHKIQGLFRQSPLAPKLAFLPANSFHTTLYSLIRVIDRGGPRWPQWLDPNYSCFSEVDRAVRDRIRDIPVPERVKMRCYCVLPHKLLLQATSPQDETRLRRYRDQIAQRMEMREHGHQDYVFHISLAYHLADFSPEEEAIAQELGAQALAVCQREMPVFCLPRPRFVLFNDMYAYHENLNARGTLY